MNDACPLNRMWRENLHLLDEWSPIPNYCLQSPIVCHTCRLTLVLFYRIKRNYNLSIISSVPINLINHSQSWMKRSHLSPNSPKNSQQYRFLCSSKIWLVVSTHLKNISQLGSLPQVGVKIKNIWNRHLEIVCLTVLLHRPVADFVPSKCCAPACDSSNLSSPGKPDPLGKWKIIDSKVPLKRVIC